MVILFLSKTIKSWKSADGSGDFYSSLCSRFKSSIIVMKITIEMYIIFY